MFHKQFDILTEDLKQHIEEGYKIYILAEQTKQLDRLKAIFEMTAGADGQDSTVLAETPDGEASAAVYPALYMRQ